MKKQVRPPRRLDRATLAAALVRLGKSAEEVARRLGGMGFRGVRMDPMLCPVAHYLEKTFPGYDFIAVCRSTVEVGTLQTATPPAVQDFLRGFDRGRWPKLVA